MPRAKYVNHKGRSRHFTSPEELEEQRKKKIQRASDEESSEEEEEEGSGSGDSDSSGSEYEDAHKKKGVSGLIEIENPNRAVKKTAEKVTKIDLNAAGSSKTELSRREREELEKQRAQAHYQKLHAEGKTEQARADLARLAIIKQHRAEAAARREAEKKERETKKGGKA
ncbi:28 kDa heat- and acid-stable phosphoprotein-like [Sitodiplosis mosellana]|uniref:28 kDa heat- and acid-stable phosphoprotein-like n=1 Tax=Sitodiplosis mosellana TaxID=263140 RepID=UPI002443EFA3|nr:28 kDa heat- and acid-stable phosphoprotein-like [Sitodiplosis mosellana]